MLYTKERACSEIVKLVNMFEVSEAHVLTEAEAQIENNFIRPLFTLLNWNVSNHGLCPAEYEFLVQKTDRYGKRPDYILQLDGQHLLVMDAKQVKNAMHDPRWLNQVMLTPIPRKTSPRPAKLISLSSPIFKSSLCSIARSMRTTLKP